MKKINKKFLLSLLLSSIFIKEANAATSYTVDYLNGKFTGVKDNSGDIQVTIGAGATADSLVVNAGSINLNSATLGAGAVGNVTIGRSLGTADSGSIALKARNNTIELYTLGTSDTLQSGNISITTDSDTGADNIAGNILLEINNASDVTVPTITLQGTPTGVNGIAPKIVLNTPNGDSDAILLQGNTKISGTTSINTDVNSITTIGNISGSGQVSIYSTNTSTNAILINHHTPTTDINNINSLILGTSGGATHQVGNILIKTVNDSSTVRGGDIRVEASVGLTPSAIPGKIIIKSPNTAGDAILLDGNVTVTGSLTSSQPISFNDFTATGTVKLGDPILTTAGTDSFYVNAITNINTSNSVSNGTTGVASVLATSIGNISAALTLVGSSTLINKNVSSCNTEINTGSSDGTVSVGNAATTAITLTCASGSLKLGNGTNTIGAPTSGTVSNLAIGSDGTIYKTGSSMRYKENLKYMDQINTENEFPTTDLYELDPCAFTYIADKGTLLPEFGLIAEELQKKGIFKNALRYNEEGQVDNIHYQTIFIALLYEFIKLKKEFDQFKNA